jgi:outer membrane receptor for ferrienterochelin and colicin
MSLMFKAPSRWLALGLCLSALCSAPLGVLAEGYDELSLEELLAVDLTVASRKALGSRESPGIVTLLTADDLRQAGVRDLIDALRLVPGFSFGVDVQGVVGLGMRGFWAHEGKVALFIDGIEMNEGLYSTLQFGQHYPVELIEKIEIIRGPGSAIYGGTAELAVIQVSTRKGTSLKGGQAGLGWNQEAGGWTGRRLHAAAGADTGSLDWSLALHAGQGRRSLDVYTDIYGTTLPMKENSRLDPLFLNLGLDWQGWRLRLLADGYHTTQGDQYDAAEATGSDTDYGMAAARLSREFTTGPTVRLTPYLGWRTQNPWRMTEVTPFENRVTRVTEGLLADWEPGPNLSVSLGAELYQEQAKDPDFDPATGVLFDPDQPGTAVESVEYTNTALFAQALWLNPLANLTLGTRWENHSQVGSAFVPRLALTRRLDDLHFKLLASRAFRAPAVMNISLNPDVEPETATVLEAEAGWQAGPNTALAVNLFDIVIRDAISYTYDELTQAELYFNFDRTARRGLELELRHFMPLGNLTARFALARPYGEDVDFFEVPGQPDRVLGLPLETASLALGVRLGKGRVLTPTLAWHGERQALSSVDGNGDAVVSTLDPALLLNLCLDHPALLGIPGLALQLTLHDLLDEAPPFAQAYDSWHAPLPGPGRQAGLRLVYSGNRP